MGKIILYSLILILVILVASFWFPVKHAIKKEFLTNEEFLICNKVSTTGFDWIVIDGTYNYFGYIKLVGKVPLEEYENYYPSVRLSNFVCFGKVVGEDIFDGIEFLIFDVERWEVLYPVKREVVLFEFLQPKYGFTLWDTID